MSDASRNDQEKLSKGQFGSKGLHSGAVNRKNNCFSNLLTPSIPSRKAAISKNFAMQSKAHRDEEELRERQEIFESVLSQIDHTDPDFKYNQMLLAQSKKSAVTKLFGADHKPEHHLNQALISPHKQPTSKQKTEIHFNLVCNKEGGPQEFDQPITMD